MLDRVLKPLLSSAAASALSGLCVLAVTGAISSLFEPRLLATPVPLWSTVGAGCGLVVVSVSLLLQRRSRAHRARRVFMIISAFEQKHYLASLIRNVHDVLEQHGCALELKIPQRDYSAVSQFRCLQQVIAHKNDYIGGLIVPIIPQDGDRAREDLISSCEKIACPIVFLDVEPFESESQYPPRTAFVGYQAAHIGEAAAGWVAEHLIGMQQPSQSAVLVIGGAAQHQRQQKFKEQLTAKLGLTRIVEENAEFDRGRARDVTRKQLKVAKQNREHLDAIFCTNDEMALGAVDALLTADRSASRTVVIGVDGTPQVRALIEAGPSPLRATIVQDSHKVAELGVDLLYRLIREEKVPTRTYLPGDVLARN